MPCVNIVKPPPWLLNDRSFNGFYVIPPYCVKQSLRLMTMWVNMRLGGRPPIRAIGALPDQF